MDLEHFPTSPSAVKMIGYVSEEFYAKSYVAKWLYQVMGLEWDEVWAIINTLPDQVFPETATWGLMYHEMKYGLAVRDNLSDDERREFIYQRRDVKKPMNPFGMELIVKALTGLTARVTDSNDDPDIPVNTFILEIDTGNSGADLTAAIKKIKEAKQSHVTFKIRLCARVDLIVETSQEPWLNVFTPCGTVPKTSRGLDLNPAGIDVVTSREALHDFFPMASSSGNAGNYPRESRVADLNGSGTTVTAATKSYGTLAKPCGSDLEI